MGQVTTPSDIPTREGSNPIPEVFQVTQESENEHVQLLLIEPAAGSTARTTPLESITSLTEDDLTKAYRYIKTLRDIRSLVSSQRPISFQQALQHTSAFLATDDRDRFYALLGFVHDGRTFVPTPDYNIPFDKLRAHMAWSYLQATKNLDIILACGHKPILDGSVPSWAPSWLNLGVEAEYVFSHDRKRRFRAAGGSKFETAMNTGYSEVIHTQGLIFERVDGLSSVYGRLNSDTDLQNALIQPSNVYPSSFRKFRGREALSDCLTKGLQLDRGLVLKDVERHGKQERVFRLKTFVITQRDPSQHGYTSAIPGQQSIYRRLLQICQAKPRFGSPELSLWLAENRDFLIHGKPLENPCKSRKGIFESPVFLWTLFIILYILVLSGALALLMRSHDMSLPTGALLTVVFTIFSRDVFSLWIQRIVQAQRLQSSSEQDMNEHMKKRYLRLAITGGGPGDEFGWGGRLALVPGSARRGDQIAILKGCSMPVLLRERGDGFQVIGMVYLEGAMEGEVMRWRGGSWRECKLH